MKDWLKYQISPLVKFGQDHWTTCTMNLLSLSFSIYLYGGSTGDKERYEGPKHGLSSEP